MAEDEDPKELQHELDELRAERERLAVELAKTEKGSGDDTTILGPRLRRVVAGTLVLFSILGYVLGATVIWADRRLFNTDKYVEIVAPLGADPRIQAGIAEGLTTGLFEAIPVEQTLTDILPEKVSFLAGPITGGLQDFVHGKVEGVLATPEFEDTWIEANRLAHQKMMDIIDGKSELVTTEGDEVFLSMFPLVNNVIAKIESGASSLFGDVSLPEISISEDQATARSQIEGLLGISLPDDFGTVPLFPTEYLVAAQNGVKLFNTVAWGLGILTLLMIPAALWISRSRRRTLLQLDVGILVGLVIMRQLARGLETNIVEAAPAGTAKGVVQAASERFLDSYLYATGLQMVILLAILVAALVTGPYAWAVKTRRFGSDIVRGVAEGTRDRATDDATMAWVREHREALQLGGIVVAVLLLFVIDASWLSFLVIGGIVAAYELVLVRLGGSEAEDTPAPAGQSGPSED